VRAATVDEEDSCMVDVVLKQGWANYGPRAFCASRREATRT